MAKDKPRNAVRSETKMRRGELRVNPSAAKAFNKDMKELTKRGVEGSKQKVTSSTVKYTGTNSARKPSVASVVKGAKNKMKAQGAKAMSAPTARYKQGMRNK